MNEWMNKIRFPFSPFKEEIQRLPAKLFEYPYPVHLKENEKAIPCHRKSGQKMLWVEMKRIWHSIWNVGSAGIWKTWRQTINFFSQASKIFSRFRNDVGSQFHFDSPFRTAADRNIKEDNGVPFTHSSSCKKLLITVIMYVGCRMNIWLWYLVVDGIVSSKNHKDPHFWQLSDFTYLSAESYKTHQITNLFSAP